MNRVNLIYPRTSWRPTYYLAFDFTGPEMLQDILTNVAVAKHSFIRSDRAHEIEQRRGWLDWPSRVSYCWICRDHGGLHYDPGGDPEEQRRLPTTWHLPIICGFGSTVNMAAQIAVLMGYSELVLLGCDLGFRPFQAGEPDPNHFDPAYIGHDDFPLEARDETLWYAHRIMEQESAKRGVKIYNGTLGGILDVHERVTLWP